MRKIIQIAGIGDPWGGKLAALADDGTCWKWEGGAWLLMPLLPEQDGFGTPQKHIYLHSVCSAEIEK